MDLKLNAQKREQNEKLAVDQIAAVMYGKGIASQSLKVKRSEFEKLFSQAGESNLISLDFGEGPVNVLVKDVQRDVLKHFVAHVDFYQVNMKEKINAEIPLHFIGESKAVKELGGILIKELNEVKVECLPSDLVDHIDIDISVLQGLDDFIKISDIVLPIGMDVVLDADTKVARIDEPKAEEDIPAADVVGAATEVSSAPADTKEPKK
jgi:large subunit ribosomal protein L25